MEYKRCHGLSNNSRTYLCSLTVVRLLLSISAGVGPISGVSLSGGTNLCSGTGPEPSIYIRWLEVGTVATREITFTTRCPNVPHVTRRDPLLYEFIFLEQWNMLKYLPIFNRKISIMPRYFIELLWIKYVLCRCLIFLD